jgi:GT2 family glycosyltransferase
VSVPIDVLVPTFGHRGSLAVTLAGIAGQTYRPLRILVSDQTGSPPLPSRAPEVDGVVRALEVRGTRVRRVRHLPRRGMAEHRDWLLRQATAPYALFLDDDILLEPDLVERLVGAIRREGCGFVGSALVGPSFVRDVRPHEQAIEWWDGPVRPERIVPGSPAWARHRLHNAANLEHLRRRLGGRDRLYRVAWVGGCVLYDVAALRAVGGFRFWRRLPDRHAGEDVVAQLRVMERFGGAGLFPSGAYHLELPTTIPPDERLVDAPFSLGRAALGAADRPLFGRTRRSVTRLRRRRTESRVPTPGGVG